MATVAQILEALMLICFGFSWPINLRKNLKAKSAKAMSLPFILLIITGYIFGIIAKFITIANGGTVHWYVLAVYFFNLIVVSCNIVVYFINRKYDKINEANK